jgi:hypothetical protein
MKRLVTGFALTVMIFCLSFNANAQIGIYSSAQVLERESMRVGAELVVGSIGFIGHVRYGASDQFDIGVKTGIVRGGGHSRFYVGFDGRYPFMSEAGGDNVDVNFVGLFTLSTGQSVTQWIVGVGPQLGLTVPLDNSDMAFAPYAGVLLGAARTGVSLSDEQQQQLEQAGLEADTSDTSFGALVPIGTEIQINEEIGFFGEVDIDIDGGTTAWGSFGINYNFR